MPIARASLLLVLAGCARTPHVPVDLQLDVDAPLPEGASVVRICAEDGPWRRFGAAAGRYALTGLFADVDPVITVDVLDEQEQLLATAGPVTLEAPYTVAELEDCFDCPRCEAPGVSPAEGEPALSLGVRFR